MALNIQKTSSSAGFLNILIYGEPGSGKTRFIGTAEPRFRTLIASAEEGLLSLGEGFEFFRVTKFEDLDEMLLMLQTKNPGYQCVAIDSGTEIQKVCMESILKKNGRAKAQIQDWGELGDRMSKFVRDLRDLKIHFIMTALMDEAKDETTGEVKVFPAFKGSIARTIGGYFDQVFMAHAFSKKNQDGTIQTVHQLLTRNSGKFMAKDRSGKLAHIVEPSFTAIYDTIFVQPKQPEETL